MHIKKIAPTQYNLIKLGQQQMAPTVQAKTPRTVSRLWQTSRKPKNPRKSRYSNSVKRCTGESEPDRFRLRWPTTVSAAVNGASAATSTTSTTLMTLKTPPPLPPPPTTTATTRTVTRASLSHDRPYRLMPRSPQNHPQNHPRDRP